MSSASSMYNAKRDASEPLIVEALRKFGFSVLRMAKPVDLLVGFGGITYICEVKTPKTQYGKKLNARQQEFANNWLGGKVITLRTIDDVLALRKSITIAESAAA